MSDPLSSNPALDAGVEAWTLWVDTHYPFDAKSEIAILTRMPDERHQPGQPDELNDLRGIRMRQLAAECGRAWFAIRKRISINNRRQSMMPTRELEQSRRDIDEAITGRY